DRFSLSARVSMAVELILLVATLAGLLCAYHYYQRSNKTATQQAAADADHQSIEGTLYRTDESIESSRSQAGLLVTSPAFTSEDDKRSPRRRHSGPHLISLPSLSPREACTNPRHASHHAHSAPLHQHRTAPTQDSCSPFAHDAFDSSLALATCIAESPDEERTQSLSVQSQS
ncbi:hypothetical protein PFISCL1PPCAC_12191, partial [Pristionchus fissidentatus]